MFTKKLSCLNIWTHEDLLIEYQLKHKPKDYMPAGLKNNSELRIKKHKSCAISMTSYLHLG